MSDAQTLARNSDTTREVLVRAIDMIDMSKDRKEWMRDRWLNQVEWFDRRARQANQRYSVLRVIAITGGVLVPALISVSHVDNALWVWDLVRPGAFVVSLLVAASVGLDSFFHYGDRWRHFRRTAERLKAEGWLFIEGAGRYKQHQHRPDFHDRFFPLFATKVEEMVREDVEVYLTRIVQEKPEDSEEEEVRKYLEADTGATQAPLDPESS